MGKGSKLFEGTLWQRNCAVAINDSVSNTAYAASWDGVTDAAPSKDAVYDKIEAAATAAAALVSDTAYAGSWDGVTTIAPSKNAVYDKIETVISGANALVSDTAFAGSWDGVTTIAPSKNAVYDKFVALLASGTYSPTFTSVANLDSTPTQGGAFSYMRIGAIVQVSGYATVDPTAPATITQFGISLPVTSNLGAVPDLTGVCAANAVISESGGVFADTTNDRANVHFICNSTASHALFIQFQYQVI